MFQDFPDSVVEGSWYLVKGSWVRPLVRHFSYLILTVT